MATGNRKGIKGNGVIASIRGKFCVFDSINDRRFCLEKLILEKIEQRRVPHRTSRRNRKDTIRRKLFSTKIIGSHGRFWTSTLREDGRTTFPSGTNGWKFSIGEARAKSVVSIRLLTRRRCVQFSAMVFGPRKKFVGRLMKRHGGNVYYYLP